MMMTMCVLMGVLLLSGLPTDGGAAFGGRIQENNIKTLNIINDDNGMEEKFSYSNDTADLKYQKLLTDILEDSGGNPTSTLSTIVTECLLQMSLSCVQKQLLVLLNDLSKIENIALIGDSVTIARIGESHSSLIRDNGIQKRLSVKDMEGLLGYLVDQSAEGYLDTHVIRVKLPSWILAQVDGYEEGTNALDFGFGHASAEEGKGRDENSNAR